MPAATTKQDLLNKAQSDFGKLEALLDRVPKAAQSIPDEGSDGTTLKDIVGHRGEWIRLFLGWQADGAAGKPVSLPAPGYKWNELRRFNADLRMRQQDMGWDEARALLRDNHNALIARLNELPERALYGGPMPGGNNKWTTGRWAEAAGPSHYRSAAKYIRKRLRDLEGV